MFPQVKTMLILSWCMTQLREPLGQVEDLGELVLGVGCFGEHPPGEYAGEGLLGLISLRATGSGGACSESATGVQSVVIHLVLSGTSDDRSFGDR